MAESCHCHGFHDVEELHRLRRNLLRWYDSNKRELPWRTLALTESDVNIRAYGVWVSEIMLQQTQVVTVIDYYTRWMKKWPTVEALAAAKLEEVRAAWSGLGYYSRGDRLWKAAQKVVSEMNGVIPNTVKELISNLPGVGKYTAGAIMSIAFNKVAGVVDGNVVRVFSRQRVIGNESSSLAATKQLWDLAETCVDVERPGDFNQALMELGAVVCTPKTPHCQDCPINSSCLAFKKVKGVSCDKATTNFHSKKSSSCSLSSEGQQLELELEPGTGAKCSLCLPEREWNSELGVTNYPHKTKKSAPPVEEYCVVVIEDKESQFLLKQRPPSGLLAGLWEFPSVLTTGENSQGQQQHQWKQLLVELQVPKEDQRPEAIGTEERWVWSFLQVTHKFSHVHHVYHCWHVLLSPRPRGGHKSHDLSASPPSSALVSPPGIRWVGKGDLSQSAVPASVKKIVKLLDSKETKNYQKRLNGSPTEEGPKPKRQKTLKCFIRNT